MKKLSELVEIPVVSMKEGETEFEVADVGILIKENKIEHIVLRKCAPYFYYAVKFEKILNIGDSCVVVADSNVPTCIFDAFVSSNTVISYADKEVVSTSGDRLGYVEDVAFDEKTGEIIYIQIAGDSNKTTIVPASDVRFFETAIIVDHRAEIEQGTVLELLEAPEKAEDPTPPIIVSKEIEPAPVVETIEEEKASSETKDTDEVEDIEDISFDNMDFSDIDDKPIAEEPIELEQQVEEESVEATGSALEVEQLNFFVGKVLKNDLVAEDGSFTLKKGTKLTKKMIDTAKQHSELLSLSVNIN